MPKPHAQTHVDDLLVACGAAAQVLDTLDSLDLTPRQRAATVAYMAAAIIVSAASGEPGADGEAVHRRFEAFGLLVSDRIEEVLQLLEVAEQQVAGSETVQ
jgi:hypothetical protein